MKKVLMSLIVVLFTVQSFYGAPLTIIKIGGKLHKDGTVTYNYVRKDFRDGYMTRLECRDKGPNSCELVGVVTIGYSVFNLEVIIGAIESTISQSLLSGKNTGRIVFEEFSCIVYFKDASFVVDDEGQETSELEYVLTFDVY